MPISKRLKLKSQLIAIIDSPELLIDDKAEKVFDLLCPRLVKKPKEINPQLFFFASEIAILCSLAMNNGSKAECFSAANKLLNGINPPKNPKELRPYFGKGGSIYQEWPWSKDGRLKPMDIPKHWPRLSGAIKPPPATSPDVERRKYVEGEYAEFIEH